jgi:phosphoribosylformylglycinamidine (FGAM) synthase-like enzyme
VAECALASGLGAHIDLSDVPKEGLTRSDLLVTSETQNRFLITVKPEDDGALQASLQGKVIFARIGTVTAEKTVSVKTLEGQNEVMTLQQLNDAYTAPIREDLPENKA